VIDTKTDISITTLFTRTADCTSRIVVNVGGAGSSKSYSIAQLLVHKFITEDHKTIGIGRTTMPSLRMTAYKLIVDVLKLYGLYARVKENKTSHTIEYKSNIIQFFSTGGREANIERLKSTNFHYIWLEEANEFTWDDFLTIDLRLRAPTVREYNQIYLSLNPTNATGWIPTRLMLRKDVTVIHSTYKDNPFCSADYIETLLNLMEQDENYYRIYALGEWGVLENLVFKRLDLNCLVPKEWDMMAYGLDFGFSPGWTALVKVMISNNQTYYQEKLYEQKLTNSDLIERLSHLERGDIYADNQEPARIEEIRRAGYNIFPAKKDVKLGLDIMRREPLHITEDSVNLAKEAQNYQHKKDKNGIVLEEVVKYFDHAIDAARYGKMGLVTRFGFATAAPVGSSSMVTSF